MDFRSAVIKKKSIALRLLGPLLAKSSFPQTELILAQKQMQVESKRTRMKGELGLILRDGRAHAPNSTEAVINEKQDRAPSPTAGQATSCMQAVCIAAKASKQLTTNSGTEEIATALSEMAR